MKTIFFSGILSLLLAGFESSVGQPNPYTIQLKSRVFIPEAGFNQYFDQLDQIRSARQELVSGKLHALIQFYTMPDESQRLSLTKLGISLHDYIPELSFVRSRPIFLTLV